MAANKNYEKLLEEVCEKLDNLDNVKEVDVNNIRNSVESIETLITDTQAKHNFQEIKEKLEKIAYQVDSCNDSLLKDLYNDLNTLKEKTSSVGQHLENIQNLQNLALTSSEFEEYQKQQLDLALKTNENVFNEIKLIKENTQSGINIESIKNLETQINNLHDNLKTYIGKIASRVELVPGVEEIGSVVSDLNSVQQKSIKQTNVLIKEIEARLIQLKNDFDGKDFSKEISKISEIYDSLGIILSWIEKVGYINQSIENVYSRLGENIDFDDVSDKVDIIYENITALNNWTMKIDKVDESMLDIQSKLSGLSNYMADTQNLSTALDNIKEHFDTSLKEQVDFEDLGNKIDIVYENLSAINEWASKVDRVSETVNKVSETVDRVSESVDKASETVNNLIDEESIAEKIDVVYENISLLNNWVNKIDNLTQKSEALDNKYTEANDGLNNRIDEINATLAKAINIVEDVPNIKDKLEELSNELHAVTSTAKSDADSYIYSLLDIESDFLKLHKFLDDNTKITSNDINALKERFSELNDDISSISIRTNKLILSSDEANKEFKTCLDTFKEALQDFDEQRQSFNPELKFAMLDNKVSEIAGLIQETNNASKNLNNAFIYLADWVDATGSLLNTMQSDLNTVKNDNSSVVELKLLSGDIADLIKKTDAIAETFENYKKNDIAILKEAISYIITKTDEHSELAKNNSENNVNEFKSLHNEFSPIHDEISNLGSEIASARDEFSLFGKDIEAIKNSITSISETKDEVSLVSEGVETIKNCITVIGEAIDGVNTEITENRQEISSVGKEISGIKEEIKTLKTNLKEIDEDIANFKTDDISELKSSLTGIMVQLNTALIPDIDTLNKRIDKITEESTQNLSKIETLVENSLKQQDKKISALEDKLDGLNSKLDKLVETAGEANKQDEIKDILNYIVTQLTSTNDNITTNQQNAYKVLGNVADKVSSFDSNINKIVSYIEED